MPEEGSVDARGIQPFYTGLLARMTDMDITIGMENEMFYLTAVPKAARGRNHQLRRTTGSAGGPHR